MHFATRMVERSMSCVWSANAYYDADDKAIQAIPTLMLLNARLTWPIRFVTLTSASRSAWLPPP